MNGRLCTHILTFLLFKVHFFKKNKKTSRKIKATITTNDSLGARIAIPCKKHWETIRKITTVFRVMAVSASHDSLFETEPRAHFKVYRNIPNFLCQTLPNRWLIFNLVAVGYSAITTSAQDNFNVFPVISSF